MNLKIGMEASLPSSLYTQNYDQPIPEKRNGTIPSLMVSIPNTLHGLFFLFILYTIFKLHVYKLCVEVVYVSKVM